MTRYLCIHGHFYQPPRENPWLEVIERQDSAHPYHDWNERITSECYAPNAVSRILDPHGKIAKIVNNYSWISFNMGPTLLHWMEQVQPEVYAAILEADRISQERFGGHGSALAQVYNHVIMPLANARDKHTQVYWGIRDFQHRFGRYPEGMWLAETAVDTASLEALAAHDIRFTVLAPHQARRIRALHGGEWQWVEAHQLDTTRPYRAFLPSGRSIDLFFYHGPVSRAVAFEKLLVRGERFANRMMDIYHKGSSEPQLAHIATDGETYGHHHPHGDMALAYALNYIQSQELATLTNYGEFLEKHPPAWEVEIVENSAWSCAHGVGRWKEDCGCNSGGHPGWRQHWRRPLREALDTLRDKATPLFKQKGDALFDDPWTARNHYIDLVLDRSPDNINAFLQKHAPRPLSSDEQVEALQLLEMQRHLQLMYTSCAWFFDELSGIETVQVIKYAARALQLGELHAHETWEPAFLQALERAPSNLPEHKNGRRIYEKWIAPDKVDLSKAAKHYAVLSMFKAEEKARLLPVFEYHIVEQEQWHVGQDQLLVGQLRVQSAITRKQRSYRFAVLLFGKYNIMGGLGDFAPPEEFATIQKTLKDAFLRADITNLYRLFDQYFNDPSFDLSSLFHDQQRTIIAEVLENTMGEVEDLSRQLYRRNASLIRYLVGLKLDLPLTLKSAVQWVLHTQIEQALEHKPFDRKQIRLLLQEAQLLQLSLDHPQIALGLQSRLEEFYHEWEQKPLALAPLVAFQDTIAWSQNLSFDVDLYRIQNQFHRLRTELRPVYLERLHSSKETEQQWAHTFAALNNNLRFQPLENPSNPLLPAAN